MPSDPQTTTTRTFPTPDAAADACMNDGWDSIGIETDGWVAWQTAKEVFDRIERRHPGIRIALAARANGSVCGRVPARDAA